MFENCLQIDELTKKFVKSADELCKAKEKEITQGWEAMLRCSYNPTKFLHIESLGA